MSNFNWEFPGPFSDPKENEMADTFMRLCSDEVQVKNTYNKAVEQSLKKGKIPCRKRRISEETKNKILLALVLVIILGGSIHINSTKKDNNTDSKDSSYSESYNAYDNEQEIEDYANYKGRK